MGDQYADSQGVKAIDYLKIDVEGWEMPVLQGFRVLLENHCIRCIQFEVTPNTLARGDNFADFFDLFSPLDYSIHAIQPNGKLRRVTQGHEVTNVYLPSNYVAISNL